MNFNISPTEVAVVAAVLSQTHRVDDQTLCKKALSLLDTAQELVNARNEEYMQQVQASLPKPPPVGEGGDIERAPQNAEAPKQAGKPKK